MTSQEKTKKTKEIFLQQISRTPIIESAAEKVGITRQTVYRWKREDPEFAKALDEALRGGRELVNDVAVSQLLNAIKKGNMTAIMYWLNHFDENFKTKIEVTGSVKQVREELTEEEAAILAEALRLAGFTQPELEAKVAEVEAADSHNNKK